MPPEQQPTPRPTPLQPTPPAPVPAPDQTPQAAPNPFGGASGTSTPTEAPTPAFNPAPEASPNPTPAPGRSKKPLIIILIVVAVLLIGGAAAAFFVLDSLGLNKSNTADINNAHTIDPALKESIVASSISDYKQVCEGKKISNAVAANKPYKVLPYIQNKDHGLVIFAIPDERLSSKQDEVNVVGCFIPKESTRHLVSQNCEATNLTTNQKVKVDIYVSDYTVTFYSAQSGEVIESKDITIADPGCPQYATEDGDVDANPDMVDIKPVLDPILAS